MRMHDEYGPVMAHYFYAYDSDTISDIRRFLVWRFSEAH